MKTKTDKELADELDATKRLKSYGYKKISCKSCNGGLDTLDGRYCFSCGGKGYIWEAPLMG